MKATWYINGLLGTLAVAVIAATFARKPNTRAIRSGVGFAAMLVWPIVWEVTIGNEVLCDQPITMLAFFWPLVVGVIQQYVTTKEKSKGTNEECKVAGTLSKGLKTDAAALVTFGLGLATMIFMQKNKDSQYYSQTQRALMVSIVLALSFIIPTSHIGTSGRSAAVHAGQSSALNYAIGLFLAAIILNVDKKVAP